MVFLEVGWVELVVVRRRKLVGWSLVVVLVLFVGKAVARLRVLAARVVRRLEVVRCMVVVGMEWSMRERLVRCWLVKVR